MAGTGEALPIAAWRALPMRPAMTAAGSSSSRQSGGASLVHMAIEIADETLSGGGESGVFRKVCAVGRVTIGQRQGPGAPRRNRDRLDIEPAEGAGGEHGI